MQDKFDEIYNSLVNGQHKQAVAQFCALPDALDRADCFTYLADELNQPRLALNLARKICLNCNIVEQ